MTKQELIETAKAMIAAPSCCQDLKTVAQAWIDAVGTAGEKAAADALSGRTEGRVPQGCEMLSAL